MHVPLSTQGKVNDFKGQKPAGGTSSQDISSTKGQKKKIATVHLGKFLCDCREY